MIDMNKFGKLIADKRKKAGLTQDTFAAKLGITPQAVSKWENGLTYPDVTLFPEIAQILDIPISSLFGEEPKNEQKKNKETKFDATYRSMPLVFQTDRAACYAEKTVMKIDHGSLTVFFTDGSYADLAKYIIKNCGAGDIYIKRAENREYEGEIDESSPNEINTQLKKFDSIKISVSCSCDVYINKSEMPNIFAKGSKRFISCLKYEVRGKELWIEVKPPNNTSVGGKNRIDLCVDFCRGKDLFVVINGSGLCKSVPPFENASITINGSGDVALSDVVELKATVNGSGDMEVQNVTNSAFLTVNGSGDMDIGSAKNVKMSVNGAGDLKVGKASGELYIKVMGAADVSAAGNVDKLYCKISGSADIKCSELTVGEAEIYADNAASIHIGHIVISSIEKLGMMSELKVDKRG